MIALVGQRFVADQGLKSSLLAVVAELEFDSVIPPPDTIEEENLRG